MTFLAHGVGSRTDLPIPLGLALYGGGAVVLISFAALLLLWRKPKMGDSSSGRPLPAAVQRAADSPALRRVLQGITLAVAGFVTVAAFAGPDETSRNIAPWAVYVTFWVGLVPVSLLFGPVWKVVNPLRLVHRALWGISSGARGAKTLPRLGLWPAAVSLAVFVWLELVPPQRAEPSTVGWFLVLYAASHTVAALWFGEGWFARGDGFEVYSTLLGRLSPWGRRDDGRLVFRNPLTNVLTTPAEPGLAAVVMVLLGSTAFDGLSRTVYWQTGPGEANDILSGTLGLVAMIALVAALYVVGTRLSGRLSHLPLRPQPRLFAATVIPIALGYTIAHYFSLLFLDGQTTWILASNPFGLGGVDLLGTYGNRVD